MDDRALKRIRDKIEAMAAGRNQTLEEYCVDNRKSDMEAYRLVAELPAIVDELLKLRALRDLIPAKAIQCRDADRHDAEDALMELLGEWTT